MELGNTLGYFNKKHLIIANLNLILKYMHCFRIINIQKMQKNLYISNLHTPLGYHISQFFREDHLTVNPNFKIVGSSSSPVLINGVTTQIDFNKYPQIACRTALDCDIVILDLRSSSHEAEVIIRFLQHAVDKSCKKIRVIGLSSVLTWEGMKAFELQTQSSDKQVMMGNILDENKWKPITYCDSDYSKRVPGHLSTKCYELQNLLLGLNKKQNIRATVVACGVMYGKENSEMQSDIVNALSNKNLTIWGNGGNVIPLTHIQSFLDSLKTLIESNVEYSLVVDSKSLSQQRVKELITTVTGSRSQLKKKDPLFLTHQQSIWTLQLRFKATKVVEGICSQRNFQDYCTKHLLKDLCEYTQWKPKQLVVFTNKLEPQLVERIQKQIQDNIEIIGQQQFDRLNQQLKIARNPPQVENQGKKQPRAQKVVQPVVIPDYFDEVVQQLLKNRKYHNYMIMCNSSLKEHFRGEYFYDCLVQLVQEKDQQAAGKSIVVDSEQYYNFLGLERMDNQKQVKTEPKNQVETNNVYKPQKIGKKDEKIMLTTQYLMDNVLVAVSQAKFKMKSKGKQSLSDFIEELKRIWISGNYRACIDEGRRKEYFGDVAPLI